jgi:hypothetical protein
VTITATTNATGTSTAPTTSADASTSMAAVFRPPRPASRGVAQVGAGQRNDDRQHQPRPQQPIVAGAVDPREATIKAGHAVALAESVGDVPDARHQRDDIGPQRRPHADGDQNDGRRPGEHAPVGPALRRIAVHQPQGERLVGKREHQRGRHEPARAVGIVGHRVDHDGEGQPQQRHRDVVGRTRNHPRATRHRRPRSRSRHREPRRNDPSTTSSDRRATLAM